MPPAFDSSPHLRSDGRGISADQECGRRLLEDCKHLFAERQRIRDRDAFPGRLRYCSLCKPVTRSSDYSVTAHETYLVQFRPLKYPYKRQIAGDLAAGDSNSTTLPSPPTNPCRGGFCRFPPIREHKNQCVLWHAIDQTRLFCSQQLGNTESGENSEIRKLLPKKGNRTAR